MEIDLSVYSCVCVCVCVCVCAWMLIAYHGSLNDLLRKILDLNILLTPPLQRLFPPFLRILSAALLMIFSVGTGNTTIHSQPSHRHFMLISTRPPDFLSKVFRRFLHFGVFVFQQLFNNMRVYLMSQHGDGMDQG